MTISIRTLGLATAALAMLAGPPVAAKEKKSGEEKLAELLEGRVAGEPQSCITSFHNDHVRVIDDTALVYGRGKTIYVNRTKHPESIDDDDVLVIKRYGSQLCKLDNVTTVDRHHGMFTGVVFLDDFVPYTRVEKSEEAESAG